MKPEQMGSVVRVLRTLHRRFTGPWAQRQVQWTPLDAAHPRAGWIVGWTAVWNGRVKVGAGYNDQSYFQPEVAVQCVLVKYWPTMRPVKVPLDGFEPTDEEPMSPSARSWKDFLRVYPEQAQKWKEQLRKEMSTAPRDEKGRWI